MRRRIIGCLVLIPLLGSDVVAQGDAGKMLRERLEGRYKEQLVQVIPPGVFVGIADLKGPSFFITQHDFSVHYDHFVEGMEIPKGYQKRDRLDKWTTQEVEATAVQYVSTMEAGETLEVVKLQMLKRGKQYMVDLLLRAIAARHLSVRARQAAGATIVARNDVGVHFRFYFPPEVGEPGDYDAIVSTIDRYLLPKAEYEARQAKAIEAASTPKTVTLGQSVDEVMAVLGPPETIIKLAEKTTFVYRNMKVVFVDGKVVDVQ